MYGFKLYMVGMMSKDVTKVKILHNEDCESLAKQQRLGDTWETQTKLTGVASLCLRLMCSLHFPSCQRRVVCGRVS